MGIFAIIGIVAIMGLGWVGGTLFPIPGLKEKLLGK